MNRDKEAEGIIVGAFTRVIDWHKLRAEFKDAVGSVPNYRRATIYSYVTALETRQSELIEDIKGLTTRTPKAPSDELRGAIREALGRMSGCPLPDCHACRSNRESIEELVRLASAGRVLTPLFCQTCFGRGLIIATGATCTDCNGRAVV